MKVARYYQKIYLKKKIKKCKNDEKKIVNATICIVYKFY